MTGLTEVIDYRDHPEIWSNGQYALLNRAEFLQKLPPNACIIEGPVAETVPEFVATQTTADSPIGFVSVDLDLYSSTVPALEILTGSASTYLPACMMYFDDIDGLITLNRWSGEELAIDEFNSRDLPRKIQRKITRTPKSFACHVLDHPVRAGEETPLVPLEIPASVYS